MAITITMRRPDLADLPEVALPEGYRLLTAAEVPQLAETWVALINESFGDQDWSVESVTRDYISQPQYDPAGIFFVAHGERLVATAFAWRDEPGETEQGRVHWVGTVAEHRGRGLAKALVVATLRYMARKGLSRAVLGTQSYRAPAIKCYLGLGFEPYPRGPEEEAEWALGLQNVAELEAQRG